MAESTTTTIRKTDLVRSPGGKATRSAARMSRRGAFSALAGVAALAPITAQAARQEEPLEALWASYLHLKDLWVDAVRAVDEADRRARDSYPQRPKSLFQRVKSGDTETLRPMIRHDFVRKIEESNRWTGRRSREQTARLELRLRLFDKWDAACDAVRVAHGLPDLERLDDEAYEKKDAAMMAVLDTSPRTPKGALILLKAINEYFCCSKDGEDYELVMRPAPILKLIRDFEELV